MKKSAEDSQCLMSVRLSQVEEGYLVPVIENEFQLMVDAESTQPFGSAAITKCVNRR